MKLLNKKNSQNITRKILITYILCQPIIDLITSLMTYNGFEIITLGVIIRTSFMIFAFGYVFYLNKDKKISKFLWYFSLSIVIYSIIFLSILINKHGLHTLMNEIKIFVKYFYFPISLMSVYCIIKALKIKISYKWFCYSALLYVLLILLPGMTNTDFNSYNNGKVGSIGWFYAPNEIGAIIALLIPITIEYIMLHEKNKKLYYLLFAGIIYVALFIGTKVPLMALFLSLGIFIFLMLIKFFIIKDKNYLKLLLNPILVFLVVALLLAPSSSSVKNMGIQLKWLQFKNVGELVGSENNEEAVNSMIYSSRNKYLAIRINQWHDASLSQKLFGMGMAPENDNKLVEMDYYDIFFGYGVIGFIIYFIPLFYMLQKIIIILFKKFKQGLGSLLKFNLEGSLILIFLSMLIAYFAGHVYSAPAVSIYLIMILALMVNKLESEKLK